MAEYSDFIVKLDALAESYLDRCNGASTRSLLLTYLKMLANESAQLTTDHHLQNMEKR